MLFALLLGILVALNPCQLAISISALTFLLKKRKAEVSDSGRVIACYALGRTTTYVLLAWLLLVFYRSLAAQIQESRIFEFVEMLLPYFLFAMSVFFLLRGLLHSHHSHGECHHSGQIIHREGRYGAYVLGILLAFAFCPESAVMYFGLMIPASISSSVPLLVPVCFAVGASLPVLAVGFLIMRLAQTAIHFSHRMETFQRILNLVFSVIFFAFAVWLII